MAERVVREQEVNLNLNVRGIRKSATLKINELSDELIRSGKKVYKYGLGQSPFPVPEIVQKALRENAHQKDYLPVKGLPNLREAVANYNFRKFGIKSKAEDILIGPGSKELMFLLQLVHDGDLLIPMPSWVSYAPQAKIIGRNVHWLETDAKNSWRLTKEILEAHCQDDPDRHRTLILNYPCNPTGATYSLKELSELAEVARKYKVLVLSDEIYGELQYDGNHNTIARYYPERTIISSGLSKWCGAGGWRLGTFSFPEELRALLEAMARVASETFTSTSAPIQYAAVTAYNGGDEIEKYQAHSRRILKTLARELSEILRKNDIYFTPVEGAFYMFLNFNHQEKQLRERGISTSEELCNLLLKDTGVAVLPGSSFGRPVDELTIRLAFVNFDGNAALEASYNIPIEKELSLEFVRTWCADSIHAMDLISQWVKE
jgi:aspartate aminotransferase